MDNSKIITIVFFIVSKVLPFLVFLFFVPYLIEEMSYGIEIASILNFLPLILLSDLGFSQKAIIIKSENLSRFGIQTQLILILIVLINATILINIFSIENKTSFVLWSISYVLSNFFYTLLLRYKKYSLLLLFTTCILTTRWLLPYFLPYDFLLSGALLSLTITIIFTLSIFDYKIFWGDLNLQVYSNSIQFIILAFSGAYWTFIDRYIVKTYLTDQYLSYSSIYIRSSSILIIIGTIVQFVVSSDMKIKKNYVNLFSVIFPLSISILIIFSAYGFLFQKIEILPIVLNLIYCLQTIFFYQVINNKDFKQIVYYLPILIIIHFLISDYPLFMSIGVQIFIHTIFTIYMYAKSRSSRSITN